MSSTFRHLLINGVSMEIADLDTSNTPIWVYLELRENDYGLDSISFQPGDVVIDIGAHVGMVSVYLAKRHPEIEIYAYEPIPDNYNNLLRNLERNVITNVRPSNLAVTADGRSFRMTVNERNTGGSTGWLRDQELPNHRVYDLDSITLDAILKENGIDTCRLLKIDCEGAEHEVLKASSLLGRVEYLSGEVHTNERLTAEGHTAAALRQHCIRFIDPRKMRLRGIRMAE